MKARSSLTAYQLKWFAAAMMLADHTYKIFLPQILDFMARAFQLEETACYQILMVPCGITAASFFIFAFLCGESCRYTRHKSRYIRDLSLFAVASEIPFQLMKQAINGEPLQPYWGFSNVLVTLLLGALACFCFDEASKRDARWAGALFLLSCTATAYLFQTDYHAYGVLAVFVCWYFQEKKERFLALGTIVFLLYGVQGALAFLEGGFAWFRLLPYLSRLFFSIGGTLWLLNRYNGKRGKGGKYFFYLFYPIHIVLIVCFYFLINV